MADYRLMKENGAYVREMLKKGRYDDVSMTGWGRLDELIGVMVLLMKYLMKEDTELLSSCLLTAVF